MNKRVSRKSIILTAIILIAVFCLFGKPGSIFAETEGELTYQMIDGTVLNYSIKTEDSNESAVICGWQSEEIGWDVHLEIPGKLNGSLPVKAVGQQAFAGDRSIKIVSLRDGIESIEAGAFAGCTGLRRIYIPESVTYIAPDAFDGCELTRICYDTDSYGKAYAEKHNIRTEASRQDKVYSCTDAYGNEIYYKVPQIKGIGTYGAITGRSQEGAQENMLVPAEVPDPDYPPGGQTIVVREVAEKAFEGDDVLQEVVLADGISEVKDDAFTFCTNLKSVILPEGMERVTYQSFTWCPALEYMYLPLSLEFFDPLSIKGSESLTRFDFPQGSEYFMEDGILYRKDSGSGEVTLIYYPFAQSDAVFTVPDSVTNIGGRAFYCCRAEEIIIPKSVKKMEFYVFEDSTNLKKITIPSSVQHIGSLGYNLNAVLYVPERSYALYFAQKENFEYVVTEGDPPVEPEKYTQSISCAKSFTKTCGTSFYLKAKARTAKTYKSSNTKIATVSSSGRVTLKEPGTVKITIKAAQTDAFYGATKTVTVKSKLAKPVLTAVNMKTRKVKLTWNKVPGAEGYKVYVCIPGSSKYKCRLTKSSSVKSVTHRGLAKSKVYKYKVRAFAKVNGKIVYSAYSAVKKVRIRR